MLNIIHNILAHVLHACFYVFMTVCGQTELIFGSIIYVSLAECGSDTFQGDFPAWLFVILDLQIFFGLQQIPSFAFIYFPCSPTCTAIGTERLKERERQRVSHSLSVFLSLSV